MQVDHGGHACLRQPPERGLKQIERLGFTPTVHRPHLFLVDGQTQVIEPIVAQSENVLALEESPTRLAACRRLTEPVGDVNAAVDREGHKSRRGNMDFLFATDGHGLGVERHPLPGPAFLMIVIEGICRTFYNGGQGSQEKLREIKIGK